MSRSFFLSPDPRPNHPFTATLVVEGVDADGKPLAVIGDEYIIAAPKGSILFDPHSMRIENIDEKANLRAELKFVSREGFNQSGKFKIACMLARDPILREETTVTVAAINTAATTTPPAPPTPVIKTTDAAPRPGIPLIGAPNPTLVATPVTPRVVPIVTPFVAPTIMPPTIKPSRKPIVTASLVVLAAIGIAAGFFFTKEPAHTSNTPATANTPDAVDNKADPVKAPQNVAKEPTAPDVATTPPTHVQQAPVAPEPEVGDDEDEINEEAAEEETDPEDQQPPAAAPPIEAASKCGACP